jgi:hypothetical protein
VERRLARAPQPLGPCECGQRAADPQGEVTVEVVISPCSRACRRRGRRARPASYSRSSEGQCPICGHGRVSDSEDGWDREGKAPTGRRLQAKAGDGERHLAISNGGSDDERRATPTGVADASPCSAKSLLCRGDRDSESRFWQTRKARDARGGQYELPLLRCA